MQQASTIRDCCHHKCWQQNLMMEMDEQSQGLSEMSSVSSVNTYGRFK